jgi:O-antigen ligase
MRLYIEPLRHRGERRVLAIDSAKSRGHGMWEAMSLANRVVSSGTVSPRCRSGFARVAFCSLWLFVFAIPSENGFMISGVGTAARLIGVVAFALTVAGTLETGRIRPPGLGLFVLCLFAVLVTMSYAWSFDPSATGAKAVTCAQLLTFAWLVWEHCRGEREQVLLMKAFVFGTVVSGADTVARFLRHQETGFQRFAGASLNPNDLGLCMAMSIPLSYFLSLRSGRVMTWFYRIQIMLAAATILLTASRTALLAGVVAIGVVPVVHWKAASRRRFANLAFTIALIVVAVLLAPEYSLKRLSTISAEVSGGTLDSRTTIWRAGLELFPLHPLLGIGAGAYPELVAPVIGRPIEGSFVAHNTFLSVLVEEGVIGFGIFCWALALLVAAIRTMPPLRRVCWAMVLAVWAVGVMAGTWEYYKETWFLFSMVPASCCRQLPESRSPRGDWHLWRVTRTELRDRAAFAAGRPTNNPAG